MRAHSANELIHKADILGPDSVPRTTGIRAGLLFLSGSSLEEAQGSNAKTTHLVTLRAADSRLLDDSCYLVVDGVTYIVDFPVPTANRIWAEVYCHAIQGTPEPVVYNLDGGTF